LNFTSPDAALPDRAVTVAPFELYRLPASGEFRAYIRFPNAAVPMSVAQRFVHELYYTLLRIRRKCARFMWMPSSLLDSIFYLVQG
jgi:hypothetical protein